MANQQMYEALLGGAPASPQTTQAAPHAGGLSMLEMLLAPQKQQTTPTEPQDPLAKSYNNTVFTEGDKVDLYSGGTTRQKVAEKYGVPLSYVNEVFPDSQRAAPTVTPAPQPQAQPQPQPQQPAASFNPFATVGEALRQPQQ